MTRSLVTDSAAAPAATAAAPLLAPPDPAVDLLVPPTEPGMDASAPPVDAHALQTAWQESLQTLQADLPAHFGNLLGKVRAGAWSNGHYELYAPTEFVRDWLVRRMARNIETSMEQFLGVRVAIEYRVEAETGGHAAPPPPAPTPAPAKATTHAMAPAGTTARAAVAMPSGSPVSAPRRTAEEDYLEEFSTSPLNKKYTFENFIVGRSNYVSHAASWAVANAPAKGQFNPLFIYGGVGLGKTHLMQAIGHHINTTRSQPARIVYVSGENFLYQVVRCIREDRMTAFRRVYRNVDVWLVDDVQYICNAERTEVEFFHVFNTLYDQGRQIVICSDKPPKDLQLTESRLMSRLEWGLISHIEPPDLEHRIAILQKRAQADGVAVAPEVLQFLAEKIRNNIRSLEGALTRLLAVASLDGRRINMDLAAETVRYYSSADMEPVRVEVDTILQVVCEHYGLPVSDVMGKKRNKEIVLPRQVAVYLVRELANLSYPDIGRAFERDYTTTIHSYEKIRAEVQRDPALAGAIADMKGKALARS